MHRLDYPFDWKVIHRKRAAIRRQLLASEHNFLEKKIAVLGGSSTEGVVKTLELFLLKKGIKPTFYESEFGQYWEEIVLQKKALVDFSPDLILIHTSCENIKIWPKPSQSDEEVASLVKSEQDRLSQMWSAAAEAFGCPIIQNNFELPMTRQFGNLDSVLAQGKTNYVLQINKFVSEFAKEEKSFFVNDINFLSSQLGLQNWFNEELWATARYAFDHSVFPDYASNVASIVAAIFGLTKKCLVLDLDNVMWGGVIGDDGLNGVNIGPDSLVGEGFLSFQRYIKALGERGVVLTVCSKNEDTNAMEGLAHPDGAVTPSDFSVVRANWDPKSENIKKIAAELNIGLDSLVFIDDSPFEREQVRMQVQGPSVPEVTKSPSSFIMAIEKNGYFESVSLSVEDIARNSIYKTNAQRKIKQKQFSNYDDFLVSLCMKAEISKFKPIYYERITQLINKTNQFNLTTNRYSVSDIAGFAKDENCLSIYGKLEDKFGDNGLVAVLIGKQCNDEMVIDTWLMSCRVFNRNLEFAMFNEFVNCVIKKDIRRIRGVFRPTKKNKPVSSLFQDMGFDRDKDLEDGGSEWVLPLEKYKSSDYKIEVIYD